MVKLRGRQHGKSLRAYEITADGIEVGDALTAFQGILTGNPIRRAGTRTRAKPKRARKP